jgi:mannose-6-phosphate isomerase-like protein (cupin superfamily)
MMIMKKYILYNK